MHADFIAEIAANPDDDQPRLVYADWLEDQGDPLGEFIRVQCARVRARKDPVLKARERELLDLHQYQWRAQIDATNPSGVSFKRGFISGLGYRGENLARYGSQIFAAAPLVRMLALTDFRSDLSELDVIPRDASLRVLRLDDSPLDDLGASRIAVHPGLRLTSLSIRNCQLEDPALSALSSGANLKRIKRLELTWNRLSDDGIVDLADVWQATELTGLDLQGNSISDRGFGMLVSSPALSRLRWLDMSHNAIRLQIPWSAPTPLLHLKFLNLTDNSLNLAGPHMLGECVTFSRLKTLVLANCNLQPSDMDAILPFRVLTELDLGENALGDAAIAALVHSPNIRLLRKLWLQETQIGDVAAHALIASMVLDGLQELDLTGNLFSPPCVRGLKERFGSSVLLGETA